MPDCAVVYKMVAYINYGGLHEFFRSERNGAQPSLSCLQSYNFIRNFE